MKIELEVEIVGHTDNMGPDVYNMDLSRRRAQAVIDYLTGKGVAEERLSLAYFGETQPVDSNDTREGRANNRRVEFVIKKK